MNTNWAICEYRGGHTLEYTFALIRGFSFAFVVQVGGGCSLYTYSSASASIVSQINS